MQVGFIITNNKCLKDGKQTKRYNYHALQSCTNTHPCTTIQNAFLLHKIQTHLVIHSAGRRNKQKTHTHIYTPTHSGKHKNQPSGSKFHFISRFSKEQAGESIHAISSCAEGGLAAMETDVAPLQTAALIQSTGVNTQAHGDGGWALLLPWLENTIAK